MTALSEATPIAGLFLGLAGSAHCVAMCGGVASALDRAAVGTGARRVAAHVLYGVGRVASYALLGAAVGGLGYAIGVGLPPAWRSGLRIAVGVLLIAVGIALSGARPLRGIERMGLPVWRRLQPLSRRLLARSLVWRSLGLGALWGFLPCGLVYGAAGIASVTGSAASGAFFMIAFGVGTMPAVFSLGAFASGFWARLERRKLRRVSAAAVMLCGVWTIVGPLLLPVAAHPGSSCP